MAAPSLAPSRACQERLESFFVARKDANVYILFAAGTRKIFNLWVARKGSLFWPGWSLTNEPRASLRTRKKGVKPVKHWQRTRVKTFHGEKAIFPSIWPSRSMAPGPAESATYSHGWRANCRREHTGERADLRHNLDKGGGLGNVFSLLAKQSAHIRKKKHCQPGRRR